LKERGRDPLKLVSEAIKETKIQLGPKPKGKTAQVVVNPDLFQVVLQRVEDLLAEDAVVEPSVRHMAQELKGLIANDSDTRQTLKDADERIKAFNKQRKEGPTPNSSISSSDTESA